LKIINQLYDSLLLTGSDDGQVLLWRNVHNCEMQTVVSGFVTNLAGRLRAHSVDDESRLDKLVMRNTSSRDLSKRQIMKVEQRNSALEWDKDNGLLYFGGSMLRLFDLRREQFTRDIRLDSHVEALTLDSTDTFRSVLGLADGSIQLIDQRQPNVCSRFELHDKRVVRVCVQGSLLHSVDPTGSFVVSDLRKLSDTPIARMQFKHGLVSFSSHRASPLIAVGSPKQGVSLFRTNVLSEPLQRFQKIKFQKGIMFKRHELVTHLEFHRREGILFAGCKNSKVSIFSSDTNQ